MSKKSLTPNKLAALQRLSDTEGVIAALAIDQRGALKKMLTKEGLTTDVEKAVEDFKVLVSKELTPYASAILLDPEYGLPASNVRHSDCGLLLAYEKTGYDATTPGRLPDSLDVWSVKRLKESGADACKFLLYYDVDEEDAINEQKRAYMERVGSECAGEDIPFFLEIVTYDHKVEDSLSLEYAKEKPRRVIEAMREFSDPRYGIDVLKMEVPVNMNYVEGFTDGEIAYSREDALGYFKAQSDATSLPYIFLSAGVSAELFRDTLHFAKEANAKFNGVLCGRATWANGVESFVKNGKGEATKWLQTQGKKNLDELNEVLKATASSWKSKLN